MRRLVDLEADPPPVTWGVRVDVEAIDRLADRWAPDAFPLPAFDYPGTPGDRDEEWWFDYVTFATSVLACLWPPPGDEMWAVEFDGAWLDDAPGIFAAFTRTLGASGVGTARYADLSLEDGRTLFAGRGTLQMVDERVETLRNVAAALHHRWGGTAANLVDAADRDGRRIAALLTETVPAFLDRPSSPNGVLPFDKLAHLAAALMAAGVGWDSAGFHGFDDFPVYPDYMLPRVLRHFGVLVYADPLADRIDRQQLIVADSSEEHALRWSTVYAGRALLEALRERGNPVTAPALDYRLWSEAVLGPDAAAFGEHHRTVTLRY